MNDTIKIRTKPYAPPTAKPGRVHKYNRTSGEAHAASVEKVRTAKAITSGKAMKPRIVEKTLTDGSHVYDVCVRNYGTTYQFDTASLKDAEAIVALFDTGAVVDVSHR